MFLALVLARVAQSPSAKAAVSSYLERGACQFGMVVGAAGDVNRDEVPDLIVGDEGVFVGDAAISAVLPPCFWIVSPKDGAIIRRVVLPASDDGYCRVEGGADFDNDGVQDLLISMAGWFAIPKAPVYLVSGATGQIIRTLTVHASRQGSAAWARVVADRDKDGRADVATLSLGADDKALALTIWSSQSGDAVLSIPIETKCGASRCAILEVQTPAIDGGAGMLVFLDGGKSSCLPSAQLISLTSKARIWVHHAPERFEGAFGQLAVLASAGGAPRVAISFDDHVDFLNAITGECERIASPTGKTDAQMGYGWALASLGDIDGDGEADLAISETEAGLSWGTVYAKSGKTGKVIWTASVPGEDVWRLGYQLSALGDVDGDGVTDLVAGTWGCKGGAAGRAYLISGKTGSVFREFRRDGDGVKMLTIAPTTSR